MATKFYKKENLANIVLENTSKYAMEIALNRAFPFFTDGLKPVARSLAYALYLESNKLKNNNWVKSQTACSIVIGRFHPHGDASVYNTAVKMEHDKGSIIETGSTMSLKTTDDTTAPRYTDIRLSPLGRELFSTIHLCDVVESEMGYEMPSNLMVRFPHQLFGYNMNIGVGIANSQLPLNPKEVIEALIRYTEDKIKGKETETEVLAEIIKGPDLYKKHTVYMSRKSLESLINNGIGHAIEVCEVETVENKGIIHIKEIPYRDKVTTLINNIQEKSNNFIDKVQNIADFGKISGIKDKVGAIYDNGSTEDDIDIVIEVDTDRGYSIEHVLNQLYNKTGLKRSHSIKYIMVNPEDNKLQIYSIRDMFNYSIEVNKLYYRTKYEKELEDLIRQNELNIVLEKVTREEHRDFVGKAFFRKDKVELLLNREGLDLSKHEIKNILFENRSVLKNLSERDRVLKELEEFEPKKEAIEKRLTEKSILTDTLNYFKKTLMPIVEPMERDSKVVYSELSKVTPKPRKVEIPEERIVVVTNNNTVMSFLDQGGDLTEYIDENTKQVFRVSDNGYLVAVTETMHIPVKVSSLDDEEVSLQTFLVDTKCKRVLNTFCLEKEPRKNLTWYFVNKSGGVKAVKEEILYSKSTVKSTIIDDDEEIIDVYCEKQNVNFNCMLIVTNKGFAKIYYIDLVKPKNKESRYIKTIKLEDDDFVVYTRILGEDFGKAEIEIELENGERKVVTVDSEFVKPILNKGVRITDKGEKIVSCQSISSNLENMSSYKEGYGGNDTTLYNVKVEG